MVNFYFKDFAGHRNFTESNEKTCDGNDRFTLSPLFNRMFILKIDYRILKYPKIGLNNFLNFMLVLYIQNKII